MTAATTGGNLPFDDDVRGKIADLLTRDGLELCHVQWKPGRSRGVLTLTIDRPAGVTLDDCEAASRSVGSLLDEMDAVPTAYVLEVASPGLDRPLWTLQDCRRFAGRRVRVQLASPVEGTSRLKGLLESVDGDRLTILDEDRSRRYTVQFGDVRLARLVPEL